MKMGKIMLEDYIILCIENKKVRIIYDAGNTDLYLWKYGSFYLSRDWLSIIPNCPKENIVLIDEITFAANKRTPRLYSLI